MQTVQITITCPSCSSENIRKNGIKKDKQQNYLCTNCKRQFVLDYFKKNNGSKTSIDKKILLMLVRGVGIRDIAVIENISTYKVLSVIRNSNYQIIPKHKHYERIEIDEFWTYVQNKNNKIWLIYAYSRQHNEILAYVWGKRDLETAINLRQKLNELSITYDYILIDYWHSFKLAFKDDNQKIGKYYTLGIERNNCRFRHRLRRAMRRNCAFSKSLDYHKKAFDVLFYYINNNTIEK